MCYPFLLTHTAHILYMYNVYILCCIPKNIQQILLHFYYIFQFSHCLNCDMRLTMLKRVTIHEYSLVFVCRNKPLTPYTHPPKALPVNISNTPNLTTAFLDNILVWFNLYDCFPKRCPFYVCFNLFSRHLSLACGVVHDLQKRRANKFLRDARVVVPRSTWSEVALTWVLFAVGLRRISTHVLNYLGSKGSCSLKT